MEKITPEVCQNSGRYAIGIETIEKNCEEALRKGNSESEKIPSFSKAEEELADAVIRIMDHCEYRGWNLAGAILAKHEYNKARPHRHGGKLF